MRAHPSFKARLSTLSDRGDIERVRFHIAVAYGRPPDTGNHVEPLLIECLRPLCKPELAVSAGLRTPRDLAGVTLIHSSNALTWADYLRRVGQSELRPANELWLDRSTMAIDAAVNGLGVVLESEILAAEELRDGRLVAPFGPDAFAVEVTSYYLVRSKTYRLRTEVAAFEDWLRAAVANGSAQQPAIPN